MVSNKKLVDQNGFSIIELMIVIVIIGIVGAFAIGQYAGAGDNFRTQNVARELKVSLERARFDSVKRRPTTVAEMAKVVINGSDGFTVDIDRNQNGQLDSLDTKVVNFGDLGKVKIVGDGLNFPVTVAFDRRGHMTMTDSANNLIDSSFIVCGGCSFETKGSNVAYRIEVSPTGTVSMFADGQTQDSLTNPNVGNVNSNSGIDPRVATGQSSAPAGTPAPTPVPTGSPTPTPTPSPTPSVCYPGEYVQNSGCICAFPMKIRGGKCR